MRLHGFLIGQTETLLAEVLQFAGPADVVTSRFFRAHPKLGHSERGVIAEAVFAVLRRRMEFAHLAESGTGQPVRRLALLGLMQTAGRQALRAFVSPPEADWLEHVAKIDPASLPLRVQMNLPDWIVRALASEQAFVHAPASESARESAHESASESAYEPGCESASESAHESAHGPTSESAYESAREPAHEPASESAHESAYRSAHRFTSPGPRFDATELARLAASLNYPAPLDLRANLLKTSRDELIKTLAVAGIDAAPTPFAPTGVRVVGKPALTRLDAFKNGWFEVQDEGSQLLCALLAPRRGEMVVDFCAGAGGKTLALGALMRSTGRLYAFDVSERRLARLKPRVAKSGLSNVHPVLIDSEHDAKIKRLAGKIDRVLVDAPCSGLGTLRRNPDLKWRQTPASVAELAPKQASILASAARLVKPGGRLVYATCSLLDAENEAVVAQFLAAHPDFAPVSARAVLAEQRIDLDTGDYLSLWPHRHATDGFFAAVFRRSGEGATPASSAKARKRGAAARRDEAARADEDRGAAADARAQAGRDGQTGTGQGGQRTGHAGHIGPRPMDEPAKRDEPAKMGNPTKAAELAKASALTAADELSKMDGPTKAAEPAKASALTEADEPSKMDCPAKADKPAKQASPTETADRAQSAASVHDSAPARPETPETPGTPK